MEKISLNQKKILIQLGIFIVALSLVWFFLYLPSIKSADKARKELSAIEKEIGEIESMLDDSVPIDESLIQLKEKSEKLDNLFPDKEEETLRAISEFAQKLNINIVSIKPQQKKIIWKKEEEEALQVDGKICQSVTVSIQMTSFYQDLVKYIEMLDKELPAFMVVESVKLIKDKVRVRELKLNRDRLNVTLNIGIYLLS